jgi:hypothetical protein
MATSVTLRNIKGEPLTATEMDNNLQNIATTADSVEHHPEDVSDQYNASTGFFDVPAGTSAQRDPSAPAGALRFNSTLGVAEYYDGTNWRGIDSPPVITSVSPDSVLHSGTEITVSGSNFQTGILLKIVDTDGTEWTPASFVRVNSGELKFDFPLDVKLDGSDPWAIKITNPSGLSTTFDEAIYLPNPLQWGTVAGSLGTIRDNQDASILNSITTSLPGLGESDVTTTLALTQGSFPTGVTVNNSTGTDGYGASILFSGDPTNVTADTLYNFTVTATVVDESNPSDTNSSSRAFNVLVTKAYDGSTSSRAAVTARDLYLNGATTGTKYLYFGGSTALQVTYEATDKFGTGDFGWAQLNPTIYWNNSSLRSSSQTGNVNASFQSNGFIIGGLETGNSALGLGRVQMQMPDLYKARITTVTARNEGADDADDANVTGWTDSYVNSVFALSTAAEYNRGGYPWAVWNGSSSANYTNGGVKLLKPNNIGFPGTQNTTATVTTSNGDFPFVSYSSKLNNPYLVALTSDGGRERFIYTNWQVWVH